MLSPAVTNQKPRFIKIREVLSRTGICRVAVYNKMRSGEFPKNIKLGARSVAWLESDIDEWIDSKIFAQ
jgi:prophage regulatory protein